MEGGYVGHNFKRGPHKHHTSQIWFSLVVAKYAWFAQSAERIISQKYPEYMLN